MPIHVLLGKYLLQHPPPLPPTPHPKKGGGKKKEGRKIRKGMKRGGDAGGMGEETQDKFARGYVRTTPVCCRCPRSSLSHLEQGSDEGWEAEGCRFRLINYRADVRFALIRNGLDYPRIVAWSDVIRLINPNQPHHGHLALTANARCHHFHVFFCSSQRLL
jgi:hypothetical protein